MSKNSFFYFQKEVGTGFADYISTEENLSISKGGGGGCS
jgi:hypothetical protein